MSHPLVQALASRWLTLACLAVIIALGAALTESKLTANRTEAALRARIAELGRENRQAAAVWGLVPVAVALTAWFWPKPRDTGPSVALERAP